jgi:predicted transcriptional regulator
MDEPNDNWKREQGFDPAEPGIFDSVDQHAIDAADARGMADHAAGRTISNAAVKRWLTDYINGNKRPRPQPGE